MNKARLIDLDPDRRHLDNPVSKQQPAVACAQFAATMGSQVLIFLETNKVTLLKELWKLKIKELEKNLEKARQCLPGDKCYQYHYKYYAVCPRALHYHALNCMRSYDIVIF